MNDSPLTKSLSQSWQEGGRDGSAVTLPTARGKAINPFVRLRRIKS